MTEHQGETAADKPRHWSEIAPKDAVGILLPTAGIIGPVNEAGITCPWPWEPQQLAGAPMGQFHCSYCGAMAVAGMPHPDYRGGLDPLTAEIRTRLGELADAGDPRVAAAVGAVLDAAAAARTDLTCRACESATEMLHRITVAIACALGIDIDCDEPEMRTDRT